MSFGRWLSVSFSILMCLLVVLVNRENCGIAVVKSGLGPIAIASAENLIETKSWAGLTEMA